ncbi:MAG TPA: sigma-54 dependent transcriptional regulator [Candidatus Nanoarchaeia archaeon]|nr:sigma-54 dependent transcriptional regulator [Candidatus Nanoarchaeia archaeon]
MDDLDRYVIREKGAVRKVIMGRSAAMQKVFALITSFNNFYPNGDCPHVLVRGESGAGKELVAEALHYGSGLNGNFVALNCSAIPASLIESELFGHERGAFTNAHTTRDGLVAQARNGTLFLDEIGDMSPDAQKSLLRFLDVGREYRPVGSSKTYRSDARVVAATNCSLEQLVAQKRFREDLYFRLNVFPVDVPPLRARPEDIPLLADFLLQGINEESNCRVFSSVSAEAKDRLCGYSWPGNVRELHNVMVRSTIAARFDPASNGTIEARHITLPTNAAYQSSIVPYAESKSPIVASIDGATVDGLVLPVTVRFIAQHYSPSSPEHTLYRRLSEQCLSEILGNKNVYYVRARDFSTISNSSDSNEQMLADLRQHGFNPDTPHRVHSATTLAREPVGLGYGVLRRLIDRDPFFGPMGIVVLTEDKASRFLLKGLDPAPLICNLHIYHRELQQRYR